VRAIGIAGIFAVAAAAAVLAWLGLAHGAVALGAIGGPIAVMKLEFGITPFAAPFCALIAALDVAVALWSWKRGRAVDAVLLAAFSAAMVLVLCAQSVAAFFSAWELMALISAFLVAAHSELRGVRRATFLYLLVSQTGASCILVLLLILALHAGDPSFAAIARAAHSLPAGSRTAVFALALAGFGSKAGFMPFHFWLPRAHPVAPAHASALLSGAMLKVALYGLALVVFILAAPAPPAWGVILVAIGTVSAVGGVLFALAERDLKQLLAYSSVENVGIIAIGLGVALLAQAEGLPHVAALALAAALFHAINHGLFKGLLFLGAGAVAESEGSVDLERLGGLWAHLVWTAPLFLIGCFAIAGLPPTNGFASEWLTFQALIGGLRAGDAVARLTLLAAIAGLALTGGLAAATFVKVFGTAFLGRPRRPRASEARRERLDLSLAGMIVPAAGCLALGIFPALATVPLARIAATLTGAQAPAFAALPLLPATLALLPLAGAFAAFALALRRGVRGVPTWTCGSPVTPAAQYSATAFTKPLRRIFSFVLIPDRQRTLEGGSSPWFPKAIAYRTESRDLADEAARTFAAITLRVARRTRIVQSGSLRLYLAYAVLALFVVVVAAAR
jgi:formate hydrogenlyase subunit 3/multisubunit Na+/H+ antiporter MnhD subunit